MQSPPEVTHCKGTLRYAQGDGFSGHVSGGQRLSQGAWGLPLRWQGAPGHQPGEQLALQSHSRGKISLHLKSTGRTNFRQNYCFSFARAEENILMPFCQDGGCFFQSVQQVMWAGKAWLGPKNMLIFSNMH